MKLKPTEITELKRMDVIEFYQYLNSYQERLDKKIELSNKTTQKRSDGEG